MLVALRRGLWRLKGFLLLSPAVCTLAVICCVVFWIQREAASVDFAYGYSFGQAFGALFGLSWPAFSHGFYWQPLTYLFLHGGWSHLLLNLLALLCFGNGVEREIGGRKFWTVFLGGGVLAGLGWLAFLALQPVACRLLAPLIPALGKLAGAAPLGSAMCVGASGGVFALIGAFAALFPDRIVYVLLFFVIPLRVKARTLAVILGVLTVVEAAVLQSDVAYAAHLAGGFAGYFYGVHLRKRFVYD